MRVLIATHRIVLQFLKSVQPFLRKHGFKNKNRHIHTQIRTHVFFPNLAKRFRITLHKLRKSIFFGVNVNYQFICSKPNSKQIAIENSDFTKSDKKQNYLELVSLGMYSFLFLSQLFIQNYWLFKKKHVRQWTKSYPFALPE